MRPAIPMGRYIATLKLDFNLFPDCSEHLFHAFFFFLSFYLSFFAICLSLVKYLFNHLVAHLKIEFAFALNCTFSWNILIISLLWDFCSQIFFLSLSQCLLSSKRGIFSYNKAFCFITNVYDFVLH